MSQIEEIKKILRQARYGATPFKMGSNPGNWHLDEHSVNDYARQIAQLYQPKPDGSRLLEELKGITRSMITASHYDNLPEAEFENYLNSIIAKTASIYEEKIREIFEEIISKSRIIESKREFAIKLKDLQAIKSKELSG